MYDNKKIILLRYELHIRFIFYNTNIEVVSIRLHPTKSITSQLVLAPIYRLQYHILL